jgi:hypothetical protein
VVGAGREPTAWLDGVVTKDKARFVGTISVRLSSKGVTTRAVSGIRCETVVEAMSLVAALLVDPENAKTAPLPPELLAPTVEAPPVTEPEPLPPVVAVPPPPVPEPVVAPSTPVTITSPRVDPVPEPRLARFGLFAGAHGLTAISGRFDVGGHGGVVLTAGRFVARVSVGAGSGATVSGDVGRAQYPFHVVGSLEAGARWSFTGWWVETGLLASLVGFSMTALDAAQPSVVWRWLVPAGPSVRLAFVVGPVTAGAHVAGGANLRRDTYQVTPDGAVFTTPAWFIHPGLFASFEL